MPWSRTRMHFKTCLQISFQSASGLHRTLRPEPNGDRIVQVPSHHQQCTVLDSKASPYRLMSWTQSNSQRLGKKVWFSTGFLSNVDTPSFGRLLLLWLIASISMIPVCCSCNAFCFPATLCCRQKQCHARQELRCKLAECRSQG